MDGNVILATSILAFVFSLVGIFLPMIQALFPRISLYTYYRQRTVRRLLAIIGAGLLIPAWTNHLSTLPWILTGFLLLFWLASELVLSPTKIIPPLDDPPALPGMDAILSDETKVLGIVVEGQPHAWPMGILIPHHIINERVHGKPVTAAYCPACRSGYVFDPVVDGQRLTFEPVSVRRRNMIMRDRETGTIWQHETGEALLGRYRGRILESSVENSPTGRPGERNIRRPPFVRGRRDIVTLLPWVRYLSGFWITARNMWLDRACSGWIGGWVNMPLWPGSRSAMRPRPIRWSCCKVGRSSAIKLALSPS
jgi:hypothetical protein